MESYKDKRLEAIVGGRITFSVVGLNKRNSIYKTTYNDGRLDSCCCIKIQSQIFQILVNGAEVEFEY